MMDTDGSGLIAFSEFLGMIRDELRLDHYHLPEVEVKKLWLALDQDGSGHIDAGEFGRFMRCGAPQRGQRRKEQLELERRERVSKLRHEEHELRAAREARLRESAMKRREQRRAMRRSQPHHPQASSSQVLSSQKEESGTRLIPHPPSMNGRIEATTDAQRASTVEQFEASITLNARFAEMQESMVCRSWYALFRSLDGGDSGYISYKTFMRMVRYQFQLPSATLSDAKLRSLCVAIDDNNAGSISWPAFARFARLGDQAPQGAAQRLIRKLEHGHVLTSVEMQELRAASDAAVPMVSKVSAAKERALAKARQAASSLRAEKNARQHRHIKEELATAGVPKADAATVAELSGHFNDQMLKLSEEMDAPMTWYKCYKFMDTDESGLLSLAEFSAMVRNVLLLPPRVVSQTTLKAVFLALDEDDSGNISVSEFHNFMRIGEPEKKAVLNSHRRKELAQNARASVEEVKVEHARRETIKAAERAKALQEEAKAMEAQLAALKQASDDDGNPQGSRARVRAHREQDPGMLQQVQRSRVRP